MPWVDQNICIGCGICIDECPADAIFLVDKKADISEALCIRCGKCHAVCPQDAVIHDSKKIPMDVAAYIAQAKRGIEYYTDEEDQQKSLQRWINKFNCQKKTAEQVITQLEAMRKT